MANRVFMTGVCAVVACALILAIVLAVRWHCGRDADDLHRIIREAASAENVDLLGYRYFFDGGTLGLGFENRDSGEQFVICSPSSWYRGIDLGMLVVIPADVPESCDAWKDDRAVKCVYGSEMEALAVTILENWCRQQGVDPDKRLTMMQIGRMEQSLTDQISLDKKEADVSHVLMCIILNRSGRGTLIYAPDTANDPPISE